MLIARAALIRVQSIARTNGAVPFWIGFELSIGTILYALALAVLAAVIMGVLPGIKALPGVEVA